MRANGRWALVLVAATLVAGAAAAAPPDPETVPGQGEVVRQGRAIDDLLLNREQYFYSSFGRRDPFGSLLKGRFARTENSDLLDVGELTLVGVVWGDDDKFCIVEDKRGHSHVMREGDRVVNGKVVEITRTSLRVQHYFFGETANVTIYMNEGVGSYDAP